MNAYAEAFKMKTERDNQFAWLQGKYVYEAVGVHFHNAFKKKGEKSLHYPNEPYEFDDPEKEDERRKKESKKLYRQFKSVVSAFNKDDDLKKRNLERLRKMNK